MKLAALIAAGEFDAIGRRIHAKITGRPPLLPAELLPRYREAARPERASLPTGRHVAMVSPPLSLSGAPLSQFELARGLASRGWIIETLGTQAGPASARYEDASLPVRYDPVFSIDQYAPAAYERGVAALAEFLGELSPNLVYANTVDLFPVIDAARVAGIPSIWNIRESEPWRMRLADRHPAVAARALAAFHYPRRVIFVAEAARNAWNMFARADNAEVVYNAPPTEILNPRKDRATMRAELGIGDDKALLVSVGTICERKGQLDLAAALPTLPESVLNRVRVAFIGDADTQYLSRLKAALPRHAKATFTGPVSDGAAFVAAADALVNTSRSEAFPRTFIEAAAADVAIIASKVDGASERLRDGESALFYEAGDTTHLGEQLARIVQDPALRQRLAAGARESLVTSWTHDQMISAYEDCFRSAIANRQS